MALFSVFSALRARVDPRLEVRWRRNFAPRCSQPLCTRSPISAAMAPPRAERQSPAVRQSGKSRQPLQQKKLKRIEQNGLQIRTRRPQLTPNMFTAWLMQKTHIFLSGCVISENAPSRNSQCGVLYSGISSTQPQRPPLGCGGIRPDLLAIRLHARNPEPVVRRGVFCFLRATSPDDS